MQQCKLKDSSFILSKGYLETEEGRGDRDVERPESAEIHKIEEVSIFPNLREQIFLSHHLE